ncbi:hypothetical protein R3P38DRAFT_2810042 [Favolaschia claudopus]|uniref:Uncharacterized protein n=1 Tax=Favolaschia claudopus TaxID=2862362 RepID=A0AAV9ZBG6_9AGAR
MVFFGNDETDEFADFAQVDIPKAKPQASRSRIPNYSADASDMALRAALHSFRKSRTAEVFGPFHFRKHGAGGIMANEVLDRIADCAHFHKIQTTADLARETDWHRITEDGTQILALITQHRPIPVPAAPTPRPLLPLNTNTPVYSTPKNRKCSKCGLSGHIEMPKIQSPYIWETRIYNGEHATDTYKLSIYVSGLLAAPIQPIYCRPDFSLALPASIRRDYKQNI